MAHPDLGALLATMLRHPELTPPADAGVALGQHLQTIRFVMQLTVREPSLWAYRTPARVLGGVRAACWDADQPVAAQALALIPGTW